MDLKAWLRAFRLPFLTAAVIPVFLGSAIAFNETGSFYWFTFLFSAIGVSLLHIATNLANDYFDHKTGNDEINKTPTPFSGGSRVIQEGLIQPKYILFASLSFFSAGSLIGLYLNWQLNTNIILILGIIGVFCGFFYTAAPFKIGYKGLGELAVGFCFGPLVVLGSYYVQARSFSLLAFLASIPVGILIALVLYLNEFPDYSADKETNKKTLVVLLGKKKAVVLYHLLLGLVYLFILFLLAFKVMPIACGLVLLSLPLAKKAFVVSKNNYDKIEELLPANASTIGLHLWVGLLLSAGFLLDKVI